MRAHSLFRRYRKLLAMPAGYLWTKKGKECAERVKGLIWVSCEEYCVKRGTEKSEKRWKGWKESWRRNEEHWPLISALILFLRVRSLQVKLYLCVFHGMLHFFLLFFFLQAGPCFSSVTSPCSPSTPTDGHAHVPLLVPKEEERVKLIPIQDC